jgi:hypothetical protein
LNDVIEQSPHLRYLIELGIAGYQDNPRFSGSPLEKLRLLENRKEYWKKMKWRGVDSYNLPKSNRFELWKARGVVLWKVVVRPDDPAHLPPGLDPGELLYGLKHYQVIRHRVRVDDSPLPVQYMSLPGRFELAAFDPGQDLIVVIHNSPGTRME